MLTSHIEGKIREENQKEFVSFMIDFMKKNYEGPDTFESKCKRTLTQKTYNSYFLIK